jgi:hypothetical protein
VQASTGHVEGLPKGRVHTSERGAGPRRYPKLGALLQPALPGVPAARRDGLAVCIPLATMLGSPGIDTGDPDDKKDP